MVSDFSEPESNKTTTWKYAVSDTTLAILALHPWDVGGLSLATSSHPGHYPEPYQSGAHNEARGPNASHMAYLSGIPLHHEEFLQSYSSHYGKTKLTVASSNSLLSKWASCCEQRNRDPIVEPVEDVAYLLIGLHVEGYQYRSLIAYHSAISSLHEWVEQSIRQHPWFHVYWKAYLIEILLNEGTNYHFRDVGLVVHFIRQLGENNICQHRHPGGMFIAT